MPGMGGGLGLRVDVKLSPTRGSGAVAPAFSPATLFSGGVQGAWYDPSDLSSMWQDSAETVPAAVNSPVGKINDKSGNGNHATQATTAAKPVLRQSGALYWLEFDGVDDVLSSAALPAFATPALSFHMGLAITSLGIKGVARLLGANPPHLYLLTRNATWESFANGSTNQFGASIAAGVDEVSQFKFLAGGAASEQRYFKDGLERAQSSTGIAAAVNNPAGGIDIGMAAGAPGDFKMHSLVVLGRADTDTERANIATHIAAKQGRTL